MAKDQKTEDNAITYTKEQEAESEARAKEAAADNKEFEGAVAPERQFREILEKEKGIAEKEAKAGPPEQPVFEPAPEKKANTKK